jgi:hypothetical protein
MNELKYPYYIGKAFVTINKFKYPEFFYFIKEKNYIRKINDLTIYLETGKGLSEPQHYDVASIPHAFVNAPSPDLSALM